MSEAGLAGLEVSASTALMGLAWLAREGAGWLRTRRKDDAETAKAKAEAGKTEAEIWAMLNDRLVAELNRRDADCEAKMKALAERLRAEADHRDRNLRQVIYALARGLKLDPKQRAILEEIAPRGDAEETAMLGTLGRIDAKREAGDA